MTLPSAITINADRRDEWRHLWLLGLLALIPVTLLLLQFVPVAAAVLVTAGFLAIALSRPEIGVLLLLVLVAADVYIEPREGNGFFASQLLVVLLFVSALWRLLRGPVRLSRSRFDWALGVFLVLAGISILAADSRTAALKAFLKLCTFAMAFLVVRSLRLSQPFLRRILALITVLAVMTALYGIYEAAAGGPVQLVDRVLNLHVTESTLGDDAVRNSSTFRYSLEFAVFLILTGSVVLARFLLETRPMVRYLWGGALAIVVGGLFSSYSRAATIGFALSLAIQLKLSKVRLRTIASFAIPLVLIGWLFVPSGDILASRASSVTDVESVSYLSRLAKWNVGVELIGSHPLLGVGLGNLTPHLPLSYETGEAEEIPNLENLFLTYAAQIGLPGAMILMTLIVTALVMGVRVYRAAQDQFLRVLGLGIAGGLAAILVNGLTDPILVGGQNSVLVFLFLGLTVGLYECTRQPLAVSRH
jgi:O-antigen ligase